MAGDRRNILQLLDSELRFIELGGYDRSRHAAWYPKSIFRDSLTCINFGRSRGPQGCRNCHLLEFVSLEHRAEQTPCHFIRLNEAGDTIAALPKVTSNDTWLKHAVKHWLRWKIGQLKLEGDQKLASSQ
jgi:hypothetical protein